jgi:acetolactate synthase-1/2/3 large subunit
MGWEDAQQADPVAVLSPLVKWSYQVRHAGEISAAIAEAFRVATSGKPGPVHLDFARDMLEASEAEFGGPASVVVPAAQRLQAAPEALLAAMDRIRRAERPVVWAGNGLRCSDGAAALLAFAERHRCPVLTTFNGIGAVPTTHPHVFGCRSRVGTRLADEILAEADLVIVAGNSLNGVSTTRWKLKLPDLVQIDIEPARMGRRYVAAIQVAGDLRAVFERLAQEEPGPNIAVRADWLSVQRRRKDEWLAQAFARKSRAGSPVLPVEIISAMNDFSRADTLWCVDASNCGIWTHLLTIGPGMDYMRPVNFSNMGFALPAAIGAKLAQPQRDVAVLAGDGALGMTMAEIETVARLQIPLPIVVMNDRGYGNIRQEQHHKYGPRNNGVDLGDIRFHEVCKALGGGGIRVEQFDQLAPALSQARAATGPFVVDVITDPDESVWSKPF